MSAERPDGERAPWLRMLLQILACVALVGGYVYFDGLGDKPGASVVDESLPDVVVARRETPGVVPLSSLLSKDKPTVVNFWASWCTACKEERPLLERLHAAQTLALLGVATHDELAAVDKAEGAAPHPYPVVLDLKGDAAQRLGIEALPFTMVVMPDGRVVRRFARPIVEADLLDLDKLVR